MNCCGTERIVNQTLSLIFDSVLENLYETTLVLIMTVGFWMSVRWSSSWIRRQSKDIYVKKAQSEGYRARSAYKLIEMNDKLGILRPKMKIMECGGAPGAWTQVLVEKVPSGLIISCDLLDYEPVGDAIILPKCDFTSDKTKETILKHLKENEHFDLVLSDMAPNASGVDELSHRQILNLSYEATKFALRHSRPGASFLTKLWDGYATNNYIDDLKRFYDSVLRIKPKSSRKDSSEIYIYASRFKGLAN